MQMLIDRSAFRARALWIALGALFVVIVMWNVPFLSQFLYPFRLFVTYVHEAGHGLAAEITGGDVVGFIVYGNGAGVATTTGGFRWLILPAGYIGTALFGAILFYVANMYARARHIAVAVALALIAFSVAYARPDEAGNPTALLIGIGFGIVLLLAAWKLHELLVLLCLNVLAMLTGLNAVLDLKSVFENSGASLGQVRNDAAAFSAEIIGLPASVWALVWSVIAVTLLALSVYLSVYRPMRQATGRSEPASLDKPGRDESIIDILKRGN